MRLKRCVLSFLRKLVRDEISLMSDRSAMHFAQKLLLNIRLTLSYILLIINCFVVFAQTKSEREVFRYQFENVDR